MNHYSSEEMKRYNYLFWETDAAYHEAALKLGLADSAMKILYAVCDNGESCRLQDVCRRSGLSKQTVNSALRKLENEGVVYLESTGAKAKNVCLTESGKYLVRKTVSRIMQMENAIFAAWPQKDVETYLELTERFLVGLQEKIPEL